MSARRSSRVVTRVLFVVALALAVLAPASAAIAQSNYPPTTPTTDPCSRTSYPLPSGCTSTQGTGASDTLPFTGGDVALLSVIGVCVLGGGVFLVFLSRRRSRSAA